MGKSGGDGIKRRDFLKKSATAAGLAAAGLAGAPKLVGRARAAKRDHILIGHPNPSTGPIADFGAATPWADERALTAINKAGGIYLEDYGKKVPVKVKVVDTESNPTKAAEVTARLITKDKVDLMVVMHTPDTVNPVTAICERYKMPCIGLDAPVEAWLTGGPYHWSYHAFWTVASLADIFVGMWDLHADKTTKIVGGLWPNDPDGTSWSEVFKKKLPPKGYKVVDPGRFPYGQKDWSSIINLFKKEKVDIITGTVIPPDWITAWRQMHQMGYIPKIATIGKAILFPSAVGALGGNLPMGLTSEVWWSPNHPYKSSLTGESAKDLCEAWTTATKKQWTQPIGFKYAGFEIAADVLTRVKSLDKEKILAGLKETKMDTIVGPVKYNDQNYSETPLVGGQWVKGKTWPWELKIVYNQPNTQIAKTGEMIFPLPG
jgi:branched-chain amino acid transport system substrate-binding protein